MTAASCATLRVLRRRRSSFIHGAGGDVEDLIAHLASFLDSRER